jgi:hypothetical protein
MLHDDRIKKNYSGCRRSYVTVCLGSKYSSCFTNAATAWGPDADTGGAGAEAGVATGGVATADPCVRSSHDSYSQGQKRKASEEAINQPESPKQDVKRGILRNAKQKRILRIIMIQKEGMLALQLRGYFNFWYFWYFRKKFEDFLVIFFRL